MGLLDLFAARRAVGFNLREGGILAGLFIVLVVFEGFGVAMLLPIFQFISVDGDIAQLRADSPIWDAAVSRLDAIGVTLSLEALLLVAFGCFSVRLVAKYAQTILRTKFHMHGVKQLRVRIFDLLLRAKLELYDKEGPGGFVSEVLVESQRAVGTFFFLIDLFGAILMVSFYLALLSILSPPMTGITVLLAAIGFVAMRGLIKRSRTAGAAMTESNRQMGDYLVSTLGKIRIVRLNASASWERDAFSDRAETLYRNTVLVKILQARIPLAAEIAAIPALFGFIWLNSEIFDESVAATFVFLAVLVRMLPVLQAVANFFQTIVSNSAAVQVIVERLAQLERLLEPADEGEQCPVLNRAITFRDVEYRYPAADRDALSGVELEIEKGTVTAIVGPSGAGKSTMIDLLPRLRDPVGGELSFDDVPMARIAPSSLRRQIAYVSQTPQIIGRTVRDHICYGRGAVGDAEIAHALDLSGAAKFVFEMPGGIDADLGPDAVRLSGGQRQRLDLARALISDASIIVLDEPTSNLDADAVEALRIVLRRIAEEDRRTIILVAHSFAIAQDADKIVVMGQGRVERAGDHDSLMAARDGWYAQAYAKQMRVDTQVSPSQGDAS